jgi:hypothetical protein
MIELVGDELLEGEEKSRLLGFKRLRLETRAQFVNRGIPALLSFAVLESCDGFSVRP